MGTRTTAKGLIVFILKLIGLETVSIEKIVAAIGFGRKVIAFKIIPKAKK